MTDTVTPDAASAEVAAQPEVELIPVPVFDESTLPHTKPRFYVYNDALHATTPDGAAYEIPLRVTKRIVEEIQDLPSTLEQLEALVQLRHDESLTPEVLDEMDIIDAREIARKFFQAFHEKEQARLGESFGSSTT